MKRFEDELGLYLVRNALESVIDPDQTCLVMLDALLDTNEEQSPALDKLSEWVEQKLGAAVLRRLGAQVGEEVLQQLTEALFAKGGGRVGGQAAITVPLPRGGSRVNLLVVAASERLARVLSGGLGMQRYSVHFAPELGLARSRWLQAAPRAVIWDATAPILASTADCAALVIESPTPALQIVWAAEQPWSSQLNDAVRGPQHAESAPDAQAVRQVSSIRDLYDLLKSTTA